MKKIEGLTPQNLWQKGKPLTYNETNNVRLERKNKKLDELDGDG